MRLQPSYQRDGVVAIGGHDRVVSFPCCAHGVGRPIWFVCGICFSEELLSVIQSSEHEISRIINNVHQRRRLDRSLIKSTSAVKAVRLL